MRSVVLNTLGGRLELCESPDPPAPNHEQICVRVLACAVSPLNIKALKMFCDGSTANVGFEVVGTVVKVGSHVDRFAENDQVMAYLPLDTRSSGYGDYCVVSACWAVKIPDALAAQPHACAAAIRAGVQAYTALYYQHRLCAGDTVLVCEGTTESRQVMIQLARHWGAKVIATVTSPLAAQRLEHESAVSNVIDLSVRGTALVPSVMEVTGGLGVDCIIDAGALKPASDEGGSAPTKHQLLTCLAAGGKWVTMVPDLQLDPPDSQLLYFKGASLCFLNEQTWALSGAQQGRFLHIMGDLAAKLAAGVVKPSVSKVVALGDLLGDWNARGPAVVGKVVLSPSQ